MWTNLLDELQECFGMFFLREIPIWQSKGRDFDISIVIGQIHGEISIVLIDLEELQVFALLHLLDHLLREFVNFLLFIIEDDVIVCVTKIWLNHKFNFKMLMRS